jgi:D-amino-acid oxidase
MPLSRSKIAVIGCGAAGLTSAIRLLQEEFEVTILAKAVPPGTTSDVAAAFWAPTVLMSSPTVVKWALTSLDRIPFRSWLRIPALALRLSLSLSFLIRPSLSPPNSRRPAGLSLSSQINFQSSFVVAIA